MSRSLYKASRPSVVSPAPLSFVPSADLLQVHSIPLSVFDEDTEEHQSQGSALEDTTHHPPAPGHRDMHHNSLSASIQPVPYPLNSPSVKFMSIQYEDKDVIWDHIKDFTEV